MQNDGKKTVKGAGVECCVMRWLPMKEAPTDKSPFIGLMEDGLIFKTRRQAYHTYMTDDEKKEFGHGGFHPTRMRYGWSYEESSSIHECKPVGWVPIPKKNA